MKSFTALCVLAMVCSAFGAPEVHNHALLVRSRRDIDLMMNTRNLIEDLVGNLRKSAQEALEAVDTFNAGIRDEAVAVREKVINDILKFRVRVREVVDNAVNRISNTSVAVKECVDSHRSTASAVFDEALASTLACVDERIAEVSGEIQNMATIANGAMATSNQALEDMTKCTGDNTNLWATGSCLGVVAMQTEIKSVGFIAQSAMTIGRINLAIITLPAALQVCAGMRLIQTGIAVGKIIVDIGSCSATGIFNTIIGRPNVE